MSEFKQKNFMTRMFTEQEALEKYYRDLRKYELDNNVPIKRSREYYNRRYELTKKIFEAELLPYGISIKKHKDLRTPENNRPKVYAVTHVGRFDIEASILTREEPAAFLWGDPGKLYKSLEKILINMLPAIFIDTDYRDDCHVGFQTMIKYLKNNLNMHINPEGAWNVLPNKVVMQIYDGAVESAMEGNADTVPVAIAFYGKTYYVSYGKEISTSFMRLDEVKEHSAMLRDEMATLKWELIEEYSGIKVEDGESIYTVTRQELIPKTYRLAYQQFIDSIMKDTDNDYDLEDIERTRYKDAYTRNLEEVEIDLEEYIQLYPGFFLASNERFANYVEICNHLSQIMKELEEFRITQCMESVPIEERLEKYKILKRNKDCYKR